MQYSMTVLFPKGSRGLKAPIRRDCPAARRIAEQDFTRLTLKVSQGTQCVLSRHLLAPLIDKVGVVEWPGFDVRSLGGRRDLFLDKRFSDQRISSFFDFERRGRDAAEYDAGVFHVMVVGFD